MRALLKFFFGLLVVLVVVAGGAYTWATLASNRILSRTFDAHSVDFPVPFPLSDAEMEELGVDGARAQQVAHDRAIERGRHLVEARYACVECHGTDFGGGVMVDAFPIGTILGPNISAGQGSRTTGYAPADWDRIVRHGILPDGRPAAMPSEDYQRMSDRELSDIIVFIGSRPPVEAQVPAPALGPLGKVLMATGQMPLSADLISSHSEPHTELPPPATASTEFGRHLAGVCTGCHREDFTGGPIAAGDPTWVPARNLTPHPDALGSWSYEEFERAMREGLRPDGTELLVPMTLVTPYAQRMTDLELEALWLYLQSVPAATTGD